MVVRQSEGRHLEILENAPIAGLPIEVDVFDGGDPDTMLATLENARNVAFTTQLSETGSGSFVLNRYDPKATAAILAVGNLVRMKVGGVYRFAYWIEEPDRVDVSPREASGEDKLLPGRGALGGLARGRVYPPIWPPAAASYRSASVTDNGAGTTSVLVPRPAGAIAGDVGLVWIVCSGATPAPPAGWKRIRNVTNGSLRGTLFRKRLVAGEPASWKFTWSAATAAIGQAVALPNATADDTQYGISDATGSGTSVKLPSVNVGVVDGVLLGFAAVAAGTAVTPPGGWTEVSDRASSGRTSEVSRLPTSPVLGDTGDLNATSGSAADWIGMQVFLPSTGSTNAVFAGATLGGVLKTLIDEAQARGAIPWLTYDFDGDVDSNGQPWTNAYDLSFHVGASLLDVWRHLVSLGLEGWMTPELKLRAFVDGSRHFEATVVLRKGHHFRNEVHRGEHAAPLATRVLVEGAGGRVVEVLEPTGTLELDGKIGRREGFVSMPTSDDATTIQRAGEVSLELANLDTKALELDVDHGPREEGHYEPFVDYRDGDWISIDTLGDGELEPHRVVSTTLEKTEDGYAVNLDLNSIQLDLSLRQQRRLDALAGGGGSSPSSGLGLGGGGGGGSSSSAGLVAVRPGDAPGYLADKIETDPATITKTVVGEAGSQRVRLAGLPLSLDDLTDVDVSSTPPTHGQAMVWNNGLGLWVPGTVGGGGGGGGVPDRLWTPQTSPSAADDEFDDGIVSGWIDVDPVGHTASVREKAGVLSVMHPGPGDTTAQLHARLKTLASGSFVRGSRIRTAVRIASRTGSYPMAGLILADGTAIGAGVQLVGLAYVSGITPTMTFRRMLNYTTDSAVVDASGVPMTGVGWHLELVWLHDNLFLFGWSPDGVSYVYGDPFAVTLTPTHMGLAFTTWTAPIPTVFSFDYFRVVTEYEATDPEDVATLDPTYGDEFNGGSLGAGWTLRNIPAATMTGRSVRLVVDAQGDWCTRGFTAPAGDFEVMVRFDAVGDFANMPAIGVLDPSGNGVCFSPYSDGNAYMWNVGGYGYSGSGPQLAGSRPSYGDPFWLAIRRVSGNYSGRWKQRGGKWSAWSGNLASGITPSQIGFGRNYTAGVGSSIIEAARFNYFAPSSGF